MTAAVQTETFSFRWGIPLDEVGHTPIPNWMFDYYAEAGVKQGEFLLIIHLARYAYERPGTVCCPSVETLAAQLGITPRALRQRLSEMEERGLLARQYRPGQTTVYDFTPFSEQVRRVKLHHDKNRKPAQLLVPEGLPSSTLPEGLPTEGMMGGHRSETSPNNFSSTLPEGLPTEGLAGGHRSETSPNGVGGRRSETSPNGIEGRRSETSPNGVGGHRSETSPNGIEGHRSETSPNNFSSTLPEGLPTEGLAGGHRSETSPNGIGGLPTEGGQERGAEEILRGTPAESFPPPRKVSAPEEQRKEQKRKKKTTTRVRSPEDDAIGIARLHVGGAVASFTFEEEEEGQEPSDVMRHPSCVRDGSRVTHDAGVPEDLREQAQRLGFRGRQNWALLDRVYEKEPLRVRHWIEALVEGRVAAGNPPGLLLVAIRDGYPAPPVPEPEFEPPDPGCDVCMGTGTPMVEGHWQHGEHCRCTWPEGYIPPPQEARPQRQPPDPECGICLGTGTPLVDGHWQRGQACGCTRVRN